MAYLVQLGTYAPLTDTFSVVLDCNDGVNLELEDLDGLIMPPPALDLFAAQNPRLPGERVIGQNYGPRAMALTLILGPAATYAAMQGLLQKLLLLQETVRVARLSTAAGVVSAPRVALLIQPSGSSTPVYADVLGMAHDMPSVGDAQAWVRLRHEGFGIELHCAPFLRGNRVTLQNLVNNAGFETPSPAGFTALLDTLANFNAYTVAGGVLTQDKATYADAVQADAPLHYYRLDEATGTTFFDATGNGQNGTLTGGVTLGTTGLLTGDSDTAATFNGTSGYVALPTIGTWPTGNTPWTLECWCKPANATNAINATLIAIGNPGTTASTAQIAQTSTGGWTVATWGGVGHDYNSNGGSAAGSTYHVVATYDGSNLRLYVNNTLYGPFAPAALNLTAAHQSIGDSWNGSIQTLFFPGVIDEVAIYGTALAAARVSAHYAAGTTTPVAAANTLLVPAGALVGFGSAAWATVNAWLPRWRFVTGVVATWYLHYANATNYLAAIVTGTLLSLVQVVGGTTYMLGTASMTLTNGVNYWLQYTQFPAFSSNPPLVTVAVLGDAGGVAGATVAVLGPLPAHDGITAVTGAAAFAVTGASLGLSGNSVKLFGPGGWSLQNSGSGVACAVWERSTATTYSGGPVQSYGAGRCDAAPAGTFNANWISGDASSAARVQQTAVPVAAPSDVLGVAVQVRSMGVANTCTQQIFVSEYDVNGNGLRTGAVIAAVTGAQASYVTLAGSYTTGANCAYVLLNLNAVDATAGSAGGSVWWDNAQVWDKTATGMAAMSYCELATLAAPAQMMVSGLQGDVPAPCQVAFGVQPAGAGLAASGSLTLYAGRRALASYGAQLVGAALQGQQDGVNQKMVLDATTWGGYRGEHHNGAGNYQPLFVSELVREAMGVYHLMTRLRMIDTPSTSQNLYAQAYLLQHAWLGNANKLDRLGLAGSTPLFPFTGTSWQLADAGQVTLPPFPLATMGDASQVYVTLAAQSSTAVNEMDDDWGALLPVDGDLLAAVFQNNASGAYGQTLGGWIWMYFDGLSLYNAAQGAFGWSLEAARLPNPAHAGGGPGVNTQTTPYMTSVGDTLPRVDPTVATINGAQVNQGVNQWVVVATDNVATVVPVVCQITYAPLYLQPR